MLAALVLAIHCAVIGFNLVGLILIPVGARRSWHFVARPGWRIAHVLSLAITAVQALLGAPCFLTIWQAKLEGRADYVEPIVMRSINAVIYYDIPTSVFAVIYLAIFVYTLALLYLVPLRWHRDTSANG